MEKLTRSDENKTDLKIISCLRKNARATLTSISKETGIPISSIFDRLKRLEAIGVILRHTSLLDMKKIASNHQGVIIMFRAKEKSKRDLEAWLMENSRINNLVKVNGDWNFIAEAFFPDIKTAEDFIEECKETFEIVNISMLYILDDLKREGFDPGFDEPQ